MRAFPVGLCAFRRNARRILLPAKRDLDPLNLVFLRREISGRYLTYRKRRSKSICKTTRREASDPDEPFTTLILKISKPANSKALSAKPIDDGDLLAEIIGLIKQPIIRTAPMRSIISSITRLPGTTSAAGEKAAFLKEIILGKRRLTKFRTDFAFELLSHMKGGPSVDVLLDLALGDDADLRRKR